MLQIESYISILENTGQANIEPGFVLMFTRVIEESTSVQLKDIDSSRILKILDTYTNNIKAKNTTSININSQGLTIYDHLSILLMTMAKKNIIPIEHAIEPLSILLTKCKYYTFSVINEIGAFNNKTSKLTLINQTIKNTVEHSLFMPHSNWLSLTEWQELWDIPSTAHLVCAGNILKIIDTVNEQTKPDIEHTVSFTHFLELLNIDKKTDPSIGLTTKDLILDMLKSEYPECYAHLSFAMSLTNTGVIYEYPEIIKSYIEKEHPTDALKITGFEFN